jgi:hypothetical protein
MATTLNGAMPWASGGSFSMTSDTSPNTMNDLFGDTTMAEIATIARLTDPVRIKAFQQRLRLIGQEYRRIIATTPCDLPGAPSTHTHSERLDWLDTQLLNPIEKLLDAIAPSHRHMLSLWPEEVADEIMPDLAATADRLRDLQKLGWHLAATIAAYRKVDLPFGPFIRFQIVAAAAAALDEHAPNLKPSRGTYDATTKQYHGHYPAIVRRIFLEITGLNEQLDRLIKEQVDQRR